MQYSSPYKIQLPFFPIFRGWEGESHLALAFSRCFKKICYAWHASRLAQNKQIGATLPKFGGSKLLQNSQFHVETAISELNSGYSAVIFGLLGTFRTK